ncbi:ribonuclease H-like domain-containing protein [Tanacetum coccineum]
MSVHNSEHNSPLNSDHDDDIHDSVTRIIKLDISDPLHLHPNDTTALTVVSIKLKGTENYQVWSCAMLLALEGKNKIGFIDGSCKRSNTDEVLGKQWDRYGSSIADYYHKLNALWKQYDAMIELPKCVCNASEETLLDVISAYATISSDESHRVAVGNIADEQMTTLISLIKDNKVGKNVQANMTEVNQHMTYTDKELDNVIDISYLKIKVGHPNGAEAYISKIGNLRLSNGLTLYDIMVIPEYCVTLISVHKLVKENKVIVAFDENRCYFLNQDLNLKNVMGIDEQCEGLVILAKQTREPFPLSDHKSKNLSDLVHLDLWGPYKVTSSEGFRFFLTVKAVWVYLIKSKDKTPFFCAKWKVSI